jgi:hypothetical protein
MRFKQQDFSFEIPVLGLDPLESETCIRIQSFVFFFIGIRNNLVSGPVV